MRKLAVLGGTFNPIHNGHLHLIREFVRTVGADRVLLIPTGIPPHKSAPDLAPAADRLAMCRLAGREGLFEVSDMEILREGPSYTSDTLRAVHREYPDAELYFLMGEDMFLTLREWHEPEAIFLLATVCAAPRSRAGCAELLRYAESLKPMGAKALICEIDYLPVSSTLVREAVRNGKTIADYVPPAVADYIHNHHLYLEEQNESGRLSGSHPQLSGGQAL